MEASATILFVIDAIAREAMLFAAIGFLIGGIDDLLVDLAYGAARLRDLLRRKRSRSLAPEPLPMALFIPAWDEAGVIGPMLRATLARYGEGNFRIYVGTYPNDLKTIVRVADVALTDRRVKLVVGPARGPSTKADCLNAIWRALLRDEAAGDRFAAVVLHDAEDLVHPLELHLFAAWLHDHDAVQLPVQPLADPRSPLVAGHYLDEFAESHGKNLIVREMLGAAIPFAGVGCAIRREMLGRIADSRGGQPFDAASLTEDYELGLTVAALGGRTRFVRARDAAGGLIAVRAYFPADLPAAVRQKARWLTGIALAGWDRVGWQRGGSIGEHWMRMRDRRATLAIPVLAIAYLALVTWGIALAGHWLAGSAFPTPDAPVAMLLTINSALLGWRVAMRVAFTGAAHGAAQAVLAVPRVLVANLIALLAARRALAIYWPTLRGNPAHWDKTAHHFPEPGEEAA